MIENAQRRLRNLSFVMADLNDWSAEARYDLIFANAVLQWPLDHTKLFAGLAPPLVGGGRWQTTYIHAPRYHDAIIEWSGART